MNTPPIVRLRREDTVLFVIDMQEKLLPVIHEAERIKRNCVLLLEAARQLGLPVVVTEQNPEKLGPTVEALSGFGSAEPKMAFSALTDKTQQALWAGGRRTVLLCGIEAHVCVMQTALDLLEAGYTVFVAYDAIGSRHEDNKRVGWERMMRAGALPTSSESATFELLGTAGTVEFKALLGFLK